MKTLEEQRLEDERYPKALRIECPCCHGEKDLKVYNIIGGEVQAEPILMQCCHCMGLGYVLDCPS